MLSAHKHATLRQQTAQNPYAVLGLDSTASPQQVETAYRQLALQYHPDKQLTYGAQRKATTQFLKISKAYATLTNTERSTHKKQGGRAKAKMTLSQARQQFKRTFSRKHRNKGQISKGTSKSKPTRTTKTKTGLRNIKHAVSTKNKHELAETLKQIRANESKQALNACLMLVPVFGMAAVIKMMAGGRKEKLLREHKEMAAVIGMMARGRKEKLLREHMELFACYLQAGKLDDYDYFINYMKKFNERDISTIDLQLKLLQFANTCVDVELNTHPDSSSIQIKKELCFSENSFTITLKGCPVRSGNGDRRCVVTLDEDYTKFTNVCCYE
jgi:hypothetical protein